MKIKAICISFLLGILCVTPLKAQVPEWFRGYLDFHIYITASQLPHIAPYLDDEELISECWHVYQNIHTEPHVLPATPRNLIFVDHWTSAEEKYDIQNSFDLVYPKSIKEKLELEVEGYLDGLRINIEGFKDLEEIVNAHYREFLNERIPNFPPETLRDMDIDQFYGDNKDLKTTMVSDIYKSLYDKHRFDFSDLLKTHLQAFLRTMCTAFPIMYVNSLYEIVNRL